MIEVVYAYSKTHDVFVVYYRGAFYEVNKCFLYPSNRPQIYRVLSQHLTIQTMLAQHE